jgi:ABC-type dipeptide/oligopeptide/nickel transport system ATPase subunit
MVAPQPVLSAQALRCAYAGQAPVLDGVALQLAPGEVVGLLGRSGSGKSTLARCLAGLQPFDSGELRWRAQVLPSARTRAQRRAIQYVWQEPQLALSPYRSALESALEPLQGFGLGAPGQRRATAAQMLERLGLPASAQQRRPHQLSGGQCQRVVLARALLAQPEVLLLDEPFSALDSVTTLALLDDLPQLLAGAGAAVLLVAHDRSLVRRLAQRVLWLEGGQLKAVSAAAATRPLRW